MEFCGSRSSEYQDHSHLECDVIYRGADKSLARPERKQTNVSVRMAFDICRGADKSPGRRPANVSVRMAFGI